MAEEIENEPTLTWKAWTEFMAQVVVVRADFSPNSDEVEYVAMSPLFDRLGEGEEIPDYAIEFVIVRGDVDGKESIGMVTRAFRRNRPPGRFVPFTSPPISPPPVLPPK